MTTKVSQFNTAEAGLLQAQAYRNLRKFLTGHLQKFDVTMSQWATLGLLYRQIDGLVFSDLARTLSVSLPQATNTIAALEQKGLVERKISPSDRRVKTAKLSLNGKRFFAVTEAGLRDEMKLFLSDIEFVELATYLTVLTKIAGKTA